MLEHVKLKMVGSWIPLINVVMYLNVTQLVLPVVVTDQTLVLPVTPPLELYKLINLVNVILVSVLYVLIVMPVVKLVPDQMITTVPNVVTTKEKKLTKEKSMELKFINVHQKLVISTLLIQIPSVIQKIVIQFVKPVALQPVIVYLVTLPLT